MIGTRKNMTTSRDMLKPEIIPHKKKIQLLICLALAVLTVIAFWSIKDSGFINLDDGMYVYENDQVQSGLNLNSIEQAFSFELMKKSGNWHPVTWLSLMLDHSLFGLNPTGYHIVNLLFHVLNTILLFFVLSRMTRAFIPSALVACLFAIHPLHVESVAWVSERKDVLSTFFWMLTLGAYSYYVENRVFRRYVLVLLFFALGLMSKPMLVTLPFTLLLLDFWPLGRFSEISTDQKIRSEVMKPAVSGKQKKKSGRKDSVKKMPEVGRPAVPRVKWLLIYPLLIEKIPLFALSILSCVVTYVAQQKGGAVSSGEMLPLVVRIGNAFVALGTYIGKTALPVNLAVFYAYPKELIPWQVLGSVLMLITITVVVFRLLKKAPYLATGWLWFLGTLVPVIGIVQVGFQAMADRYTYVPLIGIFIMAAWGAPDIVKKWRYRREMLLAASAVIIVCLSILTWRQVGYWHSSMTLYDHTLKITQLNWLIYNNRGVAHCDLGHYRQAMEDYAQAIESKPRYAEAYNNRGIAYQKLGSYSQAIADFSRAIEIKPAYEEAYNNRGAVYNGTGNYNEALADLSKAIEIRTDYATAYNNRGSTYNYLQNYRAAIADYSQAIRIKPRYADAYYNRGTTYNGLVDYVAAIADLNMAIGIKLDYPEAYVNRGFAYKGLGNYTQALADYSKAIAIKPDYAYAYLNRSAVYISLGNSELAVNDLKAAARIGDERAKNILKRKGIGW